MNLRYPPSSIKKKEINLILKILDSIFYKRKAVYLSIPITTGKYFSDWHIRGRTNQKIRYIKAIRDKVFPNKYTNLLNKENNIINKFRRPVINPELLNDVPGWKQEDYHTLWAHIIKKYVDIVIFADGWQYSNGCTYEFLISHKNNVSTIDEKQNTLSLNKGIKLVDSAIEKMESYGISTEFIKNNKKELIFLKKRYKLKN